MNALPQQTGPVQSRTASVHEMRSWRNVLLWAGLLLALCLLALGIGAMAVLGFSDSRTLPFTASFWSYVDQDRLIYALRSATVQASLSVIFSLGVAIPAAITVARRPHWPFMGSFVAIISLAMVVPTTVAAMGLLAVWGRQGMILDLCRMIAGDFCGDFTIYGLHGVVLAHMMLNIPLMMRVFIPLLQSIPQKRYHLAALLALGMWGRFRHVELPQIKPAIPGVVALVFLLCFTSFALVLMLGGGPKVTTLEVEIYSAVRFDFNLAAAAGLSVIQFICAAAVVIILSTRQQFDRPAPLSAFLKKDRFIRRDMKHGEVVQDVIMMIIITILIVLPLGMIAIKGLTPDVITLLKRPQFWEALQASLMVSSVSAVTVLLVSMVLAYARAVLSLPHRLGHHYLARMMVALLDAGIMLYLVIPSIVLGTAAFIVLRGTGDIFGYGFAVVVLANVLLCLPFAVKLLDRRMAAIMAGQDHVATMLGIRHWARLKILMLPVLRRDLGLVMGLTAALSIGDLGVIALFAQPDFQTLPWLLYQLAGRYAAGEAAGLALMLLVLTVMMFIIARMLIALIVSFISGGVHAERE